jgi:hypothetical protein
MISRVTAIATLFAVLGAASLAIAAEARRTAVETEAIPVIQLERVVITGKRLPAAHP